MDDRFFAFVFRNTTLFLRDVQRLRAAYPLGRILQDDASLGAWHPHAAIELDLPRADHIRINDLGPVMRATARRSGVQFPVGSAALRQEQAA